MKAISLWQPWASLIAVGAKQYETRSWKTDYRGPLLICASLKGIGKGKDRRELLDTLHGPRFQCALLSFGETPGKINWRLPFGQAIAIVDLTACTSTCDYQIDWIGCEATFGDFSPGRYAWKLENVRAIEPFPVKGRQGLFEVELPAGMQI